MKDVCMKLWVKMSAWREDEGQDLIEYALVVALIAFAAVVGMNTVATGINDAFSKVASKLASAIS